jgi:glycosyltransferase involved in cell wall biosynthesis
MKTIVFDCERMKYQDTGIFHYCLNLGRHLLQLSNPEKEKLTFFCPKKARNHFTHANRPLTQHSFQKFLMPDTNQFDIWHTTYQNSAYLPLRNKRIKVVLTIHDLNFIYDDNKTAAKKQKHLKRLQQNINRSDAIVCISDFCKADVMRYCETGIKPVHVIYNGTNTLTEPMLSPISYTPLKRFIFSIGVITKKKNFHALLPLLKNGEMELLIAGRCDDHAYLHYLLDKARELGVEKDLHVLGVISEKEKSWYFKNCYAFASTSIAEGFCLPVTEAMSVGKPLFLSDRTALPEIGGKMAFYFNDFDGNNMQHVFFKGMHQYDEMNMQDEIKKHGSTFNWVKSAQQYLDIYHSI